MSVVVPAVLDAVPKFAVQVSVVDPQPGVMVTAEAALLTAVTVRDPVPATVNAIGAMAELTITLCDAPDVMTTVGGVGLLTVIGNCTACVRLARSVTDTCTVVLPEDPIAGVSVKVQAVAGLPQFAGEITVPAEPLGIKLVVGTAETLRTPVPPTVNGSAGELLPPTMLTLCNPARVGGGTMDKAPSASTRP
jgi:hypothetical protein